MGGPTGGVTYHGYSAPAPVSAATGVAHHRPTRGVVVGAGIAIALALGLAVGLLAKPELDVASDTTARPMAPAAPGAQQGLTIQPGAVQAVATARPAGKLQVLPPDMAAAAARTAPAMSAPSATRDVSDVVADPAPAAAPAPQAYPRLAAVDGPCAGGGRAAEMVCSDPDLSAADRALNRAYRRAMRSGAIPPEQLRADQQDWLAAREDAARRSPGALARIYDRRIDELNRLADDGPG
jgi:uncharacterized protein YecT (DUF1311 family)